MLSETALFPVNDFQKYSLTNGYKAGQPNLKIMIELLNFTNNVNERNTNKVTFLLLSNQAQIGLRLSDWHTADF